MAEKKNSTVSAFQSIETIVNRWKSGTLGEVVDDWKWIFSYSKKYKFAIVFYTVLGVVSISLGLISSIASKYVIDIVTGYQKDKLVILLCIMIGSSLFSLLFSSVIKRISARLSIYINNDIQADIFDKIIDSDWLKVGQYTNGDILNRFNTDVNTVSSNAISWLPTIVIAIYNFVATFFVIWYYSKVMACIAFMSAPFMLLMSRVFIRKQREYQKKVREINSQMMTFEVETFYNMDTIKSFGISKQYGTKMRNWQQKYKEMYLKYNLFSIETNIFMSLMGLTVQMVAFLYCLWLLWNGHITYGTMTLFLTQRANLSSAFNEVVGLVPTFLNSSVSAHRIKELVELEKEIHIKESHQLDAFEKFGYSLIMNDVHFSYIENKKVIKDSDFMANPGEIVALVGPSGEGKTTMIRLLLGLIHPQDGTVRIVAQDGTSIDSNADTRHLFAYVPQGNTILSGTIAENLRMVKEDATDEEIIEALKIGCAYDFVSKMPDGINSIVREKGRGLSEGQAQRIAISRAILRDAPILLLDEATSALDVTTERNVLRNIVTQRPNKTCIVTTHRPSVLNLCQRVYRVVDNQVTELSEEESSQMVIDF
ncbi:MAG: ABC transporter ATP-binding protein [Bacillota bacterium]|nr:ABC transporter ATP-binding protein [Bacillota bacterium]